MAYQNELETWWAGMPSEIRSVFGFAYDKADELLHYVAGDPDDLARAGGVYASLGPQITQLGQTLQSDAAALGGSWEGDAYKGFKAKIDQLEQTMKATGEHRRDRSDPAGRGAGGGRRREHHLRHRRTVIEFALGTLAIAAATAIISFGASMAAWAATELADAALALSRVLEVVGKVAQVLEKVAEVLQKIAKVLEEIAKIFMDWAKFVKSLKLLPKAWTADGVGEYVSDRIMKTLIGKIDGLVGVPQLPSAITKGVPGVVGDVGDLNDDVNRAQAVR